MSPGHKCQYYRFQFKYFKQKNCELGSEYLIRVTVKQHQIFNSYKYTKMSKDPLTLKETAVCISSTPLGIVVTSQSTKY